VVMLDRRKLAVPLLAQAGAFVVVLIIGGFTGHVQPKTPSGHAATASPSGTVSSGTVNPGTGRSSGVKLSVKVTEQGTNGPNVAGSQVRVLENGTLASVASGTLDRALGYAANVAAGQYEVCVRPPAGWGSTALGTDGLAGWICSAADLGKGPQLVTFRLSRQFPQVGGQ
jgi:hypothetical protein